MFRNGRVADIVSYLVEHNLRATADELRQAFRISERTLRTDISKANHELGTFGAKVQLKRGHGYRLVFDRGGAASLSCARPWTAPDRRNSTPRRSASTTC